MGSYAKGTEVPVSQTEGEIRRVLQKAGATHYAYGETPERAMIQFALNGRHYRFEVARPMAEHIARNYSINPPGNDWRPRIEAEWRRRWRARVLWVKAMLEFNDLEPGAFETAMLAHLVLPDGQTLGGWAKPQIAAVYEHGGMPKLLSTGE